MSRYISHSIINKSILLSTRITRPLTTLNPAKYRHLYTSSPRMSEDNPQTVRPAHKRVRGSDEHVDPENTAQALSEAKGMDFKNGEIPEWLSKPPFSYGQSWEGWERKWRCSCWCGQSEPQILAVRYWAHCQPHSPSLEIHSLSRHAIVTIVSDYMVSHFAL